MTGVILRLDIDKPGDNNFPINLVANCFFLTDNIIATVHYPVNKYKFHNERPIRYRQYVILIDGHAIKVTEDDFFEFPEVDITVIRLKKSYDIEVPILSDEIDQKEVVVHIDGFDTTIQPQMKAGWENDRFIIHSYNLDRSHREKRGFVKDFKHLSNPPDDPNMQLKAAKTYILSFGGVTDGFRGSPVFATKTNEVIGIICTIGNRIKGNKVSEFYVISAVEIINCMEKAGLIEKSKKKSTFMGRLRGLFYK